MESLVVGLVALVVGGLVAAYGARAFYLLLPLFAFVIGFGLGAQAMTSLFGEGFLATIAGWGAGLVVGVAFAVLAGLVWWATVVILFGIVGYELGYGLLVAVGDNDPGLIAIAAGLVVGVALVVLALALDAPTAVVAAVTAFGGAAYLVAGLYLVLRQITVDELRDGPLGALRGDPIGLLAWAVIGVVAFLFQYIDTRRAGIEAIERSRYRFS